MSGENILVCDNERTTVDFCVEALTMEGYHVTGVHSGEEAIALAKKEPFNLLIVALAMSGIDGFQTFKAIREFDSEIVGIIITGYGSLSACIEAMKSGFKEFIIKPFTREELVSGVAETLRRNKLERESLASKQGAKLKDDFLALISHELQTPLTMVLSSSKFLFGMRYEKADENEKKMLSILKKEGNRLAKIITNLLVISGLDYQEGKHRRSLINLSKVTVETIDAVKQSAAEKEITIHNLIPEDIPHVWGVKSKIIQLMLNLLENSVIFNKKGGTVTITSEKKDDHIRVAIEDTGTGIAGDEMETIVPFLTRNDPLTRETGGMGLGLSVSKKIIEDHKGEIRVESTGQGSRVIFTLPYSIRKGPKSRRGETSGD